MPSLKLLTACEVVIIDQDGVASLIRLFNKMQATLLPEARSIPANAVVPKEWCVFSIWESEPQDDGGEFVLGGELLYPNGTPFIKLPTTAFRFGAKKRNQITGRIMGFPIGQQGEYSLTVWVDRDGNRVATSQPLILTVEHILGPAGAPALPATS